MLSIQQSQHVKTYYVLLKAFKRSVVGLNDILTYRADQCPEQYSSADFYRGKICRCTPTDVYRRTAYMMHVQTLYTPTYQDRMSLKRMNINYGAYSNNWPVDERMCIMLHLSCEYIIIAWPG